MARIEQIIADEWKARATELAQWAMDHLVNRRDVWGQYSVLTPSEKRKSDRSYKAMTLPAVAQRENSTARVTLDKLTRHFASQRQKRPQLIGLHAKSQTATSRWFGIDIDNHDPDATSNDDIARRNLNAAVTWFHRLQSQGHDPLLFDSNGAGGYHLWVLFSEPAPTHLVHTMALEACSDWQSLNLLRQPEVFPKAVKFGSLGAWFRLPGLHHTREHHSRVWGGDELVDDPWLAGHAAIDTMLACVPGPAPVTTVGATQESEFSSPLRKVSTGRKGNRTQPPHDAKPGDSIPEKKSSTYQRRGKATVCVDLDGVLAHHTGNRSIGPPIDGAVEFTHELKQFAVVIIYTARFSTKSGKRRSDSVTESLRKRLESWLADHGFAWDRICTDTAKPIASAYIDDRAVPCRPALDGIKAYSSAIEQAQNLITR